MLIPSVSYTDFKKLTPAQIRELKSCEVTSNCETLFIAIIPSDKGGTAIKDDVTTHAEFLAVRMNSISGKEYAEVKDADIPV
jgi:hypothetical protein